MFELTAGVLGGEPPVYDGASIVALSFERRNLPSQQRFIADPAVQTLSAEDAQIDLGHVQPASVMGCVVKLQAFGYAVFGVNYFCRLARRIASNRMPPKIREPIATPTSLPVISIQHPGRW